MRLFFVVLMLLTAGYASANEIYIQQVGDTLNLDITQDGTDNKIGTSSQDVILGATGTASDTMTFAITQTGNSNAITAQILGNTYTGTWTFTGNSNTVDLLCDSGGAGNCDTVIMNIAATGNSNAFTIKVGESADSDGLTANFTVTDDGAVIATDVNGKAANLTVTVNKNSSSISTVNTLDLDMAGDGDILGHTQILSVKGRGNNVTINQSGVKDNHVDLDMTGDNADVDIIQSD